MRQRRSRFRWRGNRNISCATCHHPLTDTDTDTDTDTGNGNGLSLPVGEGGNGLGVTRDTGTKKDAIHERIPRNAPPVFMIGETEVTKMFHDGRIQENDDFSSDFESPAGDLLLDTLDNIVAVQAMFPVTSPAETAGQGKENKIAKAAAKGDVVAVWDELAKRLSKNKEYVELFKAAFPCEIASKHDITYARAANAIAMP